MSNSVKYLGIHVDDQLNWKNHISYICNKISRTIGVMAKTRQNMSQKALTIMYNSLIHSQILYCLEIWGNATKTALSPIHLLQKKAVRLICGVGYRDHSAPLFHKLKIRNIFQEIKHRQQILAFEVIKNPTRYDFNIQTEHNHSYQTRFSRTNIPPVRFRTQRHGKNGIKANIVSAYNSIPDDLKKLNGDRIKYVKKKLAVLNAP